MKRIIIGAGIAIMLSLSSFTARAQENTCIASNKKATNIYFVNGVDNTFPEALDARIELSKAYKQSLENLYDGQEFIFRVAYNITQGLVRDVREVFIQKFNELAPETTLTPTQAYYFFKALGEEIVEGVLSTEDAEELAEAIQTKLAEGLAEIVEQEKADADEFIQKFRTDLQKGRRVLLIAHSQGNLFANTALASLIDEDDTYADSIGMIGVATPAVTLYDSPYSTAHDDRVINTLRHSATLFGILPPPASNVENDLGLSGDPRELLNHSFLRSYFLHDEFESRNKINKYVTDYMKTLVFPSDALLGSGAMTFTLTWGAEPDVDLHVTEPNGTHVYYQNFGGVSGYLDLDDVTSEGPEHYFVACSTLETGVYRVGVNYYSGSGPETAKVQITTGDGNTRPFSVPLTTAVGSSGDNNPIPVATVTVAQDSNGQYTFTVRAD